jgi:hypothetical protein
VHNYVKIRQHRATENNFNDGLFALNRFILWFSVNQCN